MKPWRAVWKQTSLAGLATPQKKPDRPVSFRDGLEQTATPWIRWRRRGWRRNGPSGRQSAGRDFRRRRRNRIAPTHPATAWNKRQRRGLDGNAVDEDETARPETSQPISTCGAV